MGPLVTPAAKNRASQPIKAPPSAPRLRVRQRTERLRAALGDYRARIVAAIAVIGIAAGGLLHVLGAGDAGDAVWATAVALLSAELAYEVVRTVIVERHLGVDAIALVAMVGALVLGEELAGAVVALMFSGGAGTGGGGEPSRAA